MKVEGKGTVEGGEREHVPVFSRDVCEGTELLKTGFKLRYIKLLPIFFLFSLTFCLKISRTL